MPEEIALAEADTVATLERPPVSAAFRSAGVYTFGAALPRAFALLALPLYTQVLSPAEYGTFALLVTIASAVAIASSLGLDVAIFRLYFMLSDRPSEQEQFVNSVWCILIVVPLAVTILIGAVLWPFLGHGSQVTGPDLFLALVGAASSVAATTVPLAVLRVEQRLRDFLIVTTAAAVLSTALAILFVVVFRWGVSGWLLAALLANIGSFGIAAVVVPFRRPTHVDRPLIRNALGFGAPLVPHSLAHWALQVADRVVIAGIVSGAALGVYSLASNLGLPVLLLVQSVNFAFMPTYARAREGEQARRHLADVVVLQNATVTLICAGCALLLPPFAILVTPASYGQAASLVPWIALGYGFLGLYFIPMNGLGLGGGRTKFAAVTSIAGAATNIGLLYLFVPSGGIHAAAIAAAAAYAVLLVAVFVYARKPENPVRYRWGYLSLTWLIVGIAYLLGRLVTSDSGGIETITIRSGLLLAAIAGLLAANSLFSSSDSPLDELRV